MPFPPLHIIKYLSPDDEGRICPVCNNQMIYLDDRIRSLVKCLNCGYSKKMESHISEQGKYDLPLTLIGSFNKRQWYEIYQPLDEKLYNILIEHDWMPEEAINSVINDLDLSEDEIKYFMSKIKFLEGEDSGI